MPSDIVRFRYTIDQCQYYQYQDPIRQHIGQVIVITRDKRPRSSIYSQIVYQLQYLQTLGIVKAASGASAVDLLLQYTDDQADQRPYLQELFAVQGQGCLVLEGYLYLFEGKIIMYYTFDSSIKDTPLPPIVQLSSLSIFFVRRLFVKSRQGSATLARRYPSSRWRLIQKTNPIRAELEIMHYSRVRIAMFDTNTNGSIRVCSLLLLNFIDRFGLYRNIRRSITGFYFILANLPFLERNRRTNVIPITLSPYRSNLQGIVDIVGPSLLELEARVKVTIPDGSTVILNTQTIAYIGNIPQQQENASILSYSAIYGYLRYKVYKDERSNIDFDVVENSRFYYKTKRIRQLIEQSVANQE